MSFERGPAASHRLTSHPNHQVELSDLIPGARFERFVLGCFSSFTVVNGPYSEVKNRKVKVDIRYGGGLIAKSHATDLGFIPYDNGYWNPSQLRKISE